MSYDLYTLNARIANLQAEISAIVPSPTPGELVVVDKLIVADQYPSPTLTNTIEPTSIIIDDTIGNSAQLQKSQLEFFTIGGNDMVLREDELIFTSPSGAASTLTIGALTIENGLADYTTLNDTTLNLITSTTTSFHNSSTLSFTNGATTNTLNASNWTGFIQTVNTVANLTHYLNFSDASGTGYGHPQKTAGISCNPATNTITATNFSGLASSSTTSVGVNLTSDNSSGTYHIIFSKTTSATGNSLYIDNTTGPLTYNPSTSVLTCTTFTGALSGNASTATNLALSTTPTTATFASNTLTIVGSASTSFNSYTINITGTTNTLSSINYTTPRINGLYRVGIYNAGTGDLTITATQGGTATTRTNLSSNLIVPTLRYAYMEISSMTVNALQQYIAHIYLLTP